jgi:hypothetical protein
MGDMRLESAEEDMILKTPAASSFSFEIRIRTSNDSRVFELSGLDATVGSMVVQRYELAGREQDDYLDMFERIARTFGTRLPRNRKSGELPSIVAPYQVLLDHNIAPEIWYGYGDPAVTKVPAERTGNEDWYYLFVTSNDAPNSFPILCSRTLDEWELSGFVFPTGKKPSWAEDGLNVSDYWAPEMHMMRDHFLLCFAAREKGGSLAIGLARSSRPEGPFESDDAPLITGGVIDPHLFVESNGQTFLFWKEDTNDVWPSLLSAFLHGHAGLVETLFPLPEDQRTASLALMTWPWVRTLEPMERFLVQQVLIEAVVSDFSGFRRRLQLLLESELPEDSRLAIEGILTALRTPIYGQEFDLQTHCLIGDRMVVLENDQDWEAHLIEGIWIEEHSGGFYMFYSGNDFSTPEYGTGVAVAPSPLGPYKKMKSPLLHTTREWVGPGHPSVARGPEGDPWLFLHAFFPQQAGYKKFRALLAVPLSFGQETVTLR